MDHIDWTAPACHVSTNFTVKDCLYLPKWDRLANESDGLDDTIKHNLINLCAIMEGVRAFLGNRAIIAHCTYRPEEYNKLVNGAAQSAHKFGMAMDWHLNGLSDNKGCDGIRGVLIPKLKEFGIRMEDVSDKNERNWVHIDCKETLGNRYFKP